MISSKLLALLEALDFRAISISLIFTVDDLLESTTHSTLRVRSHIHKDMALAIATYRGQSVVQLDVYGR